MDKGAITMAELDAQEVIAQAEQIVSQRKAAAAQRLGMGTDQVSVVKQELRQMREAGILVDLDIRGISRFFTQVTPAEVGFGAEDIRNERFTLGTKPLFPEHSKKIRSIEQRIRANFDKWTHSVPVFGNYKLLFWTAYEDWKQRHDELVALLEQQKQDAIRNWDQVYQQNRVWFEQAAHNAWNSLRSSFADSDTGVVAVKEGRSLVRTFEAHQRDLFVAYIVQRALDKMPTPEDIQREVVVDYKVSVLYSEAELQIEQAIQARAEATKAEAQAQQAEAQQRAFSAHLAKTSEGDKRQAQIAAWKKAEMEHARKQLSDMGSPMQDLLDSVRANLYQAVHELLAGIRRHGTFRGRASAKAAELYQTWKALNGGLLQDDALDASLQALHNEMQAYKRESKEQREVRIGDITSQLSELATLTYQSAQNVRKDVGGRASALEF